jgi:hypothetical protein
MGGREIVGEDEKPIGSLRAECQFPGKQAVPIKATMPIAGKAHDRS